MNITLDNASKDFHQLIEITGIDNMIEVCRIYGRCAIYIPKYNSLVRYDKSKRILSEFNGKNKRALMNKYMLV
ncbi:Mor transcription activator family protein [Terrisporobacter sp.]